MERQRLKLSLNRRTNPRIAGENGDGRPIVGSFSNGISGCSFKASASTSFSETKSSTSCPRSRNTSATASPGKRCPPVPPHAITAFMRLRIAASQPLSSRAQARNPALAAVSPQGLSLPLNVSVRSLGVCAPQDDTRFSSPDFGFLRHRELRIDGRAEAPPSPKTWR